MASSQEETLKRLKVAEDFVREKKDSTLGIVMVGSTAYSPNESVNEKSDLDLVVIYQDAKDSIDFYFKNADENEYLHHENYDGYLAKRKMDDIAVSIHNISYGALQKITEAKPDFLQYYRQGAKDITYYSVDFGGDTHAFQVQSIPIPGLMGVKRIDPIAFERDGKFVIGNDIDKILSAGRILHDTDQKTQKSIDNLWQNIALKVIEHHEKFGLALDENKFDITKSLCRNERFSADVKEELREKAKHYIVASQKL